MKKCKMCNNKVSDGRIYCSNACKYSDAELNAKRVRKEKNDPNKLLKCKICGWETKDILNIGGHPKRHLNVKHNIFGDYNNFFEKREVKKIEKWKCPLCEWSTKDLNNKSGCITVHITKNHNMTVTDFMNKYPNKNFSSKVGRRFELINNNYITCKICNEKLLYITNSHLKKHGITQKEYKKTYGDLIVSDYTKEKLKLLGGTKNFIYTSKQENEIINYIKSLNLNVIQSYRKLGTEIDIFIPEKNIGIEFNGLYWHSELNGKDKNYHIQKTNLCNKNGIRLIHIFEDEWKNKKEIIKSKIRHILNKNNDNKIYARNCIIKEIDSKLKNEFLNKNHIQGTDKSIIYIGAFYKKKLVSVMTFSNLRLALGNKTKEDNIFELVRFASDINYNIIGTFSKLLKFFIKNYFPKKIITYADIRFTQKENNLYDKNGFKFVSQTKPNYYYMKFYDKRLHRFNFTKSKILKKLNGDPHLTEWENMQLNGFDRIWDCGSYKYEMILF